MEVVVTFAIHLICFYCVLPARILILVNISVWEGLQGYLERINCGCEANCHATCYE